MFKQFDGEIKIDVCYVPFNQENFRILLSELKKAFGGKYTLSAAVSAGCSVVEQAYDVWGIAK